jgi:hypothetical protein
MTTVLAHEKTYGAKHQAAVDRLEKELALQLCMLDSYNAIRHIRIETVSISRLSCYTGRTVRYEENHILPYPVFNVARYICASANDVEITFQVL